MFWATIWEWALRWTSSEKLIIFDVESCKADVGLTGNCV